MVIDSNSGDGCLSLSPRLLVTASPCPHAYPCVAYINNIAPPAHPEGDQATFAQSRRSLKALATTETELIAMAAAATMGFN